MGNKPAGVFNKTKTIGLVLLLVVFLISAVKPIACFLIKKQLEKIFTHSSVTIDDLRLSAFSRFRLLNLNIKSKDGYSLSIGEVALSCTLPSKVVLKKVDLNVVLPGKDISELKNNIRLQQTKNSFVRSVELQDAAINIRSKDISVDAKISAELNLIDKSVKYCNLKINTLKAGAFNVNELSLEYTEDPLPGNLKAREISYDKARISSLIATVVLKDKSIYIKDLSCGLFGGNIKGVIDIYLDNGIAYKAAFEIMDLNIEDLVEDFELKEKFTASGDMSGQIAIEGKNLDFKVLNGKLLNTKGGTLFIKDKKFIENMAAYSNQSADILMESLANYVYNIGDVDLSLDKGNIVFYIDLNGDQGEREFTVMLHDFKLKGE